MDLFLVQKYGDFDIVVTIGVATEYDIAKRLIKKEFEKYNQTGTLIEFPDGTFKKPNSEDSEYFIQKVKANKSF